MEETNRTIVLGAIRNGNRNFKNIQKATGISPQELDGILDELERHGMIRAEEKKDGLAERSRFQLQKKAKANWTDRSSTCRTSGAK